MRFRGIPEARAVLLLSAPVPDTGDRFLGQLCDYISRAEQKRGGGSGRGVVTPSPLRSRFLCCDWLFAFNHRAEKTIGFQKVFMRTDVRVM